MAEDTAGVDFSGVLEGWSSSPVEDGLVGEVDFTGVLSSLSVESLFRSSFGTSFLTFDLQFGESSSGDLVRLLSSLFLPGAGEVEGLLLSENSLSGGRLASEA